MAYLTTGDVPGAGSVFYGGAIFLSGTALLLGYVLLTDRLKSARRPPQVAVVYVNRPVHKRARRQLKRR